MAQRPSSVRLEFLLDEDSTLADSAFAAAAAGAPGSIALDAVAEPAPPRRPAGRRRSPPKIDTVEERLCAHEVLRRFEVRRAEWYSDELAPYVEGIEHLLRQETRFSEQMHGLPGTDHEDVWSHEMVSDTVAKDPSVQRLRVWHPSIWWMAPIVRRHDKPLNMRLPLAETSVELVQELSEQVPAAWRGKRVVVQLEVETRLYWGGCAPRGWTPPVPGDGEPDRTPWQPCSFRGDGVGFSEDLLYLKKGEPMWLQEPSTAQAPLVRRTMRPGVGLLVAVPVFTFELQESTVAWVKRQAQRVLRWLGVKKTIADRDPTFAHRLKEDEPYWARVFGQPEPTVDQMQLVEKLGARLAAASAPALGHRPEGAAARQHVVLVHGGLSSVRGGFAAWLERDAQAGGRPWSGMPMFNERCVWRFEHDSFLRVARNINQLTDAIERDVIGDLPEGTLVLLAHSRGGNIARFALPRLRRRWPRWRFYALTAGSPHQGTGVFRRIGRRWSGVASVVGWFRDIASGVLDKQQMIDLLILERALAYDIPPGFRDVEPAGVARMARGQGMPEGMWVWGSEWGPGDDNPVEERLWRRVIEDWAGFEADGDGIVPKQSALAGLAHALDASPAFHTAYFEHSATVEQIRLRLEDLLRA